MTTTLTAAGGGSGNPVVFSLDSTSAAGVCQLSGTNGAVVTYTGVGKCVIDANQDGNASYQAANPVQQTIPVSSSGTPVISSSAYLPRATIGIIYHAQLQAIGGNTPYKWKLAKGSPKLPKGLKLSSTGLVSGTTEILGRVTFTVEVTGVKSRKQPNSATQVRADPCHEESRYQWRWCCELCGLGNLGESVLGRRVRTCPLT